MNNENLIIKNKNMKNNEINENPALSKMAVSGSAFLVGKAQEDFLEWCLLPETLAKNKLTEMWRFSNGNVIKVNFLEESEVCQNALITEWFDSVGITVDVMPRMNGDEIFFEPNTFCLKHEIVTEDFIQFETRQEAIKKAIIQANVIYTCYFSDSNEADR